MSRHLRLIFATIMVVSLSAPAAATVLKIATIAPNGTTWMKEFRTAGKEIFSKTDGRVTLRFYPGGVMGNDQSVLRKMRVGQLHGGALSSGALNKLYNGVQIYSLPFLFRNIGEVTHIRKIIDPVVTKELAKKGLVVLGISQGGFAHLFSNKPIRTINDLPGQKIWVPENDAILNNAFQIAGVSPVPLPISDVYTSLQTGLLDTVGINPTGAIALQWHAKVNHMIDRPLLFLMGIMVVDKKVFQKLSRQDQAVVHEAVTKAFVLLDISNRIDDEQATIALVESGIEIVAIKDADYEEWQSIARDSLDSLAVENVYSVDLLHSVEVSLKEYRENGDS